MRKLIGTRFLVVDDDPLAARAVARILEMAGAAVESAACVGGAKEAIGRGIYDGAIVDLHLLEDSGLHVIEILRSSEPPCSALMITGDSRPERWREAIARGAEDFLIKPFQAHQLLEAAKQTLERTRAWRVRLLGQEPKVRGDDAAGEPGSKVGYEAYLDELSKRGELTDAERAILALVLRGKTNREIADETENTVRNVKYFVGKILRKLGAATRTELLTKVFEKL